MNTMKAIFLLLVANSTLVAQLTATLSKTALDFKMVAGQWPDFQRVTITFSINLQHGNNFRVHRPPEWLQLMHGLGPPPYDWILTQPYYLDVRPRGDQVSAAGEYRTKIVIELSDGKLYEISVSVSVVSPRPEPVRPAIKAITNAAYFSAAGLAPGSLATIWGERLANSVAAAGSLPLPRKLEDVEVYFCRPSGAGRSCSAMELLFVSPSQINFLLRYSYIDGAGAGIAVLNKGVWDSTAAKSSSSFTVIVLNWVSPGVFSAGYDCPVNRRDVQCGLSPVQTHAAQLLRGTITDPGYRLIQSSKPAEAGGTYVAWLTGLGSDGQVGDIRARLAGLRLRIALRPPEQDLGSVADALLLYAGASRDFPGLYQINFQIPPEVARVSGACDSGKTEIWLTLFGNTMSAGIPLPLRASPEDSRRR